MREIPLTKGYIALVDDEDYEGLAGYKWQATVKKRNSRLIYAQRVETCQGKQTAIWMHRVILGAPKGMEVDHRNGNGLDNQRGNLRLATHAQNICNSILEANTSGFRGVFYDRTPRKGKRYRVRLKRQGIIYRFGVYQDAFEAACVYDDAATILFGEFARLNFPERAVDGESVYCRKARTLLICNTWD